MCACRYAFAYVCRSRQGTVRYGRNLDAIQVVCIQKGLIYFEGWSLLVILDKSIIRRIILQKNKSIVYKSIMEVNSKKFQVNQQKVHTNNCNLYRSRKMNGMVGSKHSELINRLTKQLEQQREKENDDKLIKSQALEPSQKKFFMRISQLEREEASLKKEMLRISELAKSNKNSRIAIQIQYESLLKQYNKNLSLVGQLTEKVNALTQLNGCLFKITDKFSQAFSSLKNNCQGLKQFISVVKSEVVVEKKGEQNVKYLFSELQTKLETFKGTVDNMQTFRRKLMNNLAQAQIQNKTTSERVSIMSGLNKDDLLNYEKEITEVPSYLIPKPQDPSSISQTKKLCLHSQVSTYTFLPDCSSRLSKIFQEISQVFEYHIHLLQSQKMEYQFTKNKKLIDCQKFECQICENYEKIVSQIFSIVRQAFKEIKLQFMKQTKQINDSSQIPLLL